MLYYVLVVNSDAIDKSEEQDAVGNKDWNQKKCETCHFYYFCAQNFRYEKSICDGCYHCILYEKESKSLIFRVVTIEKKGTYRTVSIIF